MFRNLTVILSVAIIIAGSIAGYLLYKDVQNPASKTIMAVPSNAGIVIESNDFPSLWKKLKQETSFWNHFSISPFVNGINNSTFYLDSLFAKEARIASIIKGRPSIVSIHLTGKSSFDYLFLIGLNNNGQIGALNNFISSAAKNSITKRTYEKVDIRDISLGTQGSFSYAFCKGIFIGSFSSGLVEDAVRQLNSENSLLNNSRNTGFEIVQVTADKKTDCNVYLNYVVLPKLLKLFLSKSLTKDTEELSSFANWTELDLKVRQNGFMLNGLTHPNDSSNKYLNIFINQNASPVELPSILPDNVISFCHFGITDFSQFYIDYKNFLDGQNFLFDYNKSIETIEQKSSFSIKNDLAPILGGEFALIKTGIILPSKQTKRKSINEFLAIKLKSHDSTLTTLISSKTDSLKRINYRGFTISPSSTPKLWSNLLRGIFKKFNGQYFTVIQNYVIFSNDVESLRSFIGAFVSGRTLKTDLGYTDFTEFTSSKSNIYFYCNIPLSIKTGLFQASLSQKTKQSVVKYVDSLKQFQAIAFQITKGSNKKRLSQKGNLFYTTLNLKYNPKYKERKQLFTQAKLEAPIEKKPWIVTNHYTGEAEVFIQDTKNNIYLIGLGGNIIWKKELNGEIIGNVKQIDIYHNKKLQLLFNTSTAVHLLDRKGRNVEKYPIKLPSKATNGITLLDYDNNKKYRLLIACENRLIYNYDKYGKIVKGWNSKKTKGFVRGEITHLSIRGKDYIIMTDDLGNVYAMDRKGESRKNIKEKFPISTHDKLWIMKESSIGKTIGIKVDTLGISYSIQFNGNKDSIIFDEFSGFTNAEIVDITENGEPDYVFLDKNELLVYSKNKDLIFSESFDVSNPDGPYVFSTKNGPKIGVVLKEQEEVYLYSASGDVEEGFPLYGNSPFVLFQSEGSNILVTGTPGNFLYIYTID